MVVQQGFQPEIPLPAEVDPLRAPRAGGFRPDLRIAGRVEEDQLHVRTLQRHHHLGSGIRDGGNPQRAFPARPRIPQLRGSPCTETARCAPPDVIDRKEVAAADAAVHDVRGRIARLLLGRMRPGIRCRAEQREIALRIAADECGRIRRIADTENPVAPAPEEIRHQFRQRPAAAPLLFRGLRQRADIDDHAAVANEVAQFFERRVADRPHGGNHDHAERLPGHMQPAVAHLGAAERFVIHVVEVDAVAVNRLPSGKGGFDSLVAVPGHHRLDGIEDRHVGDVVSLRQDITQALGTLQQPVHLVPVRLVEMVAGRRPLPPAPHGRIVKPVQAQQILPHGEIGEDRIGQLRRVGRPLAAVETFEPDALAFVEVRDRRGDLVFNNVLLQHRLVATRSLVPTLGTEIVAELAHVAATAAVVASEEQPAPLVPLIDGDEEVFLAQRHAHVVIVHAYLDRTVTQVDEQRVDLRQDVVSLAAHELVAENIVPDIALQVEVQLIGEKEIEPRFRFPGETVCKTLEKVPHVTVPRTRVHRIERRQAPLGLHFGHEGPRPGVLPLDPVWPHFRQQVDRRPVDPAPGIERVSVQRKRPLRISPRETLPAAEFQAVEMQFRTVERRVFGQHLVHIGALPHAQRIVAQADGHTAFAGLGHEPPEKLPPRRSEEVGLRTKCPAVGDAARIGVAIVDLQAADPFPCQHVELPGEMFARERVADPPIEGHLAVTCRRGSEPPFEVYIPRTVRIARWQRARRLCKGHGGGERQERD